MINWRKRHPSLGNSITDQSCSGMSYQLCDGSTLFLWHINILAVCVGGDYFMTDILPDHWNIGVKYLAPKTNNSCSRGYWKSKLTDICCTYTVISCHYFPKRYNPLVPDCTSCLQTHTNEAEQIDCYHTSLSAVSPDQRNNLHTTLASYPRRQDLNHLPLYRTAVVCRRNAAQTRSLLSWNQLWW